MKSPDLSSSYHAKHVTQWREQKTKLACLAATGGLLLASLAWSSLRLAPTGPAPTAHIAPPYPSKADPSSDVERAIHFNRSSRSELEWHLSGYTPHDLLENLKHLKQPKRWKQFFDALEKLPTEELTLFQSELEKLADGPQSSFVRPLLLKLSQKLAEKLSSRGSQTSSQPTLPTETSQGYRSALAFEGPLSPSRLPEILGLLRKHRAQATFFITTEDLFAHFEWALKLREEGHLLGSSGPKWEPLHRKSISKSIHALKESHLRILRTSGQSSALVNVPLNAAGESLRTELRSAHLHSVDELLGIAVIRAENWKALQPKEHLIQIRKSQLKNPVSIVMFRSASDEQVRLLGAYLNSLQRKTGDSPGLQGVELLSPFAILPQLNPRLAAKQ